jgi:hypothetical protein
MFSSTDRENKSCNKTMIHQIQTVVHETLRHTPGELDTEQWKQNTPVSKEWIYKVYSMGTVLRQILVAL